MKWLKILVVIFLVYYLIGFIVVNGFLISRNWGRGFGTKQAAMAVQQNLKNPVMYQTVLIWPVFSVIMTRYFITGEYND